MRPIILTTTDASGAATTSGLAVLDTYRDPFSVAVAVVVTGTVSYTVQATYDDPLAPNFDPSTATWFDKSDATSQTGNKAVAYTDPVRAIRIRQASGSGSTRTTVIQAGMPGL